MDIDRFTELAAAHGASRERWPPEQRTLYDGLAPTREGMAILADAERIDALLDGWITQVDNAGRPARILAAAAAQPNVAPPQRSPRALRAWLSTGFAASAVLGFVLGFAQTSGGSDETAYAELLFGNTSVMEEFL
jgi:hypothetical protein